MHTHKPFTATAAFLLIACCCVALLQACSGKEDPVTGLWKLPGEAISVEFSKKGDVTLTIDESTISGSFRRNQENVLLVDMGNGEQPVTLSDNGDELRLSDRRDDRDIFLRSETAEKVDRAESLFMAGYQAKNCDSSIVLYTQTATMLEGIPSESGHLARAYNNRGICEEKNGNTEAAMADYTKAIEIDPRLEIAYGNRAWLHDKLGNREAATLDYRKAAELGYTPAKQWLEEQKLEGAD